MAEVMLLEDEPVLREELGEFLQDLGYIATCVSSIGEFRQRFDPLRHALAVIDVGLPDGSGLELIGELRHAGHRLGIVVFSAHNTGNARIAGLDIGADHYLGKGIDLDELAATLASLGRRLALQPPPARWILEMAAARLNVPDAPPVPLSHQDLLVLGCLMRHAGESVGHREIAETLGVNFLDYDRRRLDTQMYRLRRRVEEISGRPLPVKTLRNSGYRFHAPATLKP
ncbi:response regulator transcription factor [Xanthomonas campestris pv. phormiicola]|nr:response regulator transcription factor [Xanthomonas campestris pv. phormiicola]UYC17321.1 response regulator transcription factor [Xanthomonas campestris pv. phormiicola]